MPKKIILLSIHDQIDTTNGDTPLDQYIISFGMEFPQLYVLLQLKVLVRPLSLIHCLF